MLQNHRKKASCLMNCIGTSSRYNALVHLVHSKRLELHVVQNLNSSDEAAFVIQITLVILQNNEFLHTKIIFKKTTF